MHNETPLNTDFYELTMAAGYFEKGHTGWASFDLFVRRLPANRNFLVVAGIQQALDYLTNLRFSGREIEYLRQQPALQHISEAFFEYLRGFQFSGNVYAMEEGSIAFPHESIMQVHAPLIEAQLIETFLISTVQFQTMVASKAARVVQAAQADGEERNVLEFGSRRAHGGEAGALAGRAAFVGGCKATSNTLAGYQFGVPVSGTMAHSWIMAFEEEKAAFEAFYQHFKEQSVFLVDTYDAVEGTRLAAALDQPFRGVRLDSGDLDSLSRQARAILDQHGHRQAQVLASGDLNEYRIRELVQAEAPIDAFGVGTQLSTSADAPYLPMVYKLTAYDQGGATRYTIKLSEEKQTLPGLKQVYRHYDQQGFMERDTIAFQTEAAPEGDTPLIHTYLKSGQLVKAFPELGDVRDNTLAGLARLPAGHKRLKPADPFPVQLSEAMAQTRNRLQQELTPHRPDPDQ